MNMLTAKRPSANGKEKSLKDLQGGNVRFNFDLDKDLHKRLKRHSVEIEEDMSVIVRRWISEKLDEAEAKK